MQTASKTHIKEKARRKTNPSLVETITLARKSKYWHALAHSISGPSRKHAAVNLDTIEKQTKAGDTVIIPGKVLASGDITKKVRISSLSISKAALEKIKKVKGEYVSLAEEIKKNPKAEGIKVLA